jgi:hypothetical protein
VAAAAPAWRSARLFIVLIDVQARAAAASCARLRLPGARGRWQGTKIGVNRDDSRAAPTLLVPRPMKTVLGLGAVVLASSLGCGTTVYVGSDDDDGSGGTGSGTGGSSSQYIDGPGPTTTVGTTSTGVIENPPGCPGAAPSPWGECPTDQLSCTYAEEQGCTVAYTCFLVEECYEGSTGTGTGGWDDGGCYPYSYWQPMEASCSPAAVDCASAQAGDVCALPGDGCEGNYGECSYEYKYCGEDHLWYIETYYDECCYDDCCYDDCYCEPYYCPETLPEAGQFCDACYDAEYCSYTVETECGLVEVVAGCDPYEYTWWTSGEGCGGGGGAGGGPDVTVSTSAQSGTGGGF